MALTGGHVAGVSMGHVADHNLIDGILGGLNATYAAFLRSSLGNRTVFLGDSITAGNDSGSGPNQNWGDSFSTYAALNSGGAIRKVRNAGVPGNVTSQMLTRFDTDVTPYAPNIVVLLAGSNDAAAAFPLATIAANYKALVAKIIGIGAMPVLCNLPPTAVTPTRARDMIRFNTWLADYAAAHSLTLVDFYSILVDTTTGGYLTAYDSGDSIHPSPAGHAVMGSLLSNVLTPRIPAWTPQLAGWNTDTDNAPPGGGLFLVDTNADGIPDIWTGSGGASGFTHSVVTDAAVLGKMAKITQTANASIRYLYSGGWAGTFAAGDKIVFGGVVTSDGGAAVTMQVQFYDAASAVVESDTLALSRAVTRGVWWQEKTVPATATQVTCSLIIAAGTGNAQWGRVTGRNLTAMGVAAIPV